MALAVSHSTRVSFLGIQFHSYEVSLSLGIGDNQRLNGTEATETHFLSMNRFGPRIGLPSTALALLATPEFGAAKEALGQLSAWAAVVAVLAALASQDLELVHALLADAASVVAPEVLVRGAGSDARGAVGVNTADDILIEGFVALAGAGSAEAALAGVAGQAVAVAVDGAEVAGAGGLGVAEADGRGAYEVDEGAAVRATGCLAGDGPALGGLGARVQELGLVDAVAAEFVAALWDPAVWEFAVLAFEGCAVLEYGASGPGRLLRFPGRESNVEGK